LIPKCVTLTSSCAVQNAQSRLREKKTNPCASSTRRACGHESILIRVHHLRACGHESILLSVLQFSCGCRVCGDKSGAFLCSLFITQVLILVKCPAMRTAPIGPRGTLEQHLALIQLTVARYSVFTAWPMSYPHVHNSILKSRHEGRHKTNGTMDIVSAGACGQI